MLKKSILVVGVLLAIMFGLSILHLAVQPKPFNWYVGLQNYSKEPFGTYVFFNQIDSLFPNHLVKRLRNEDLDNYYSEDSVLDSLKGIILDTSYLSDRYIIEDGELVSQPLKADTFNYLGLSNFMSGSQESLKRLFRHIRLGNSAQLYAHQFSFDLLHALDLEVNYTDTTSVSANNLKKQYAFETTGKRKFKLKAYPRFVYFSDYPENAEILVSNKLDQVVGVKYKIGRGELSLFTIPTVLSNYEILYGDSTAAGIFLAQLPQRDTYWSQGLSFDYNQEEKSLLSFIHAQPALKMAYYLLLITVLSYLVFRIFRMKRLSKSYFLPKNLSLEFVHTISNLHQRRKDYRAILRKKMYYLKFSIKQKYQLEATKVNESFMMSLSRHSGLPFSEIKALFGKYADVMKAEIINEPEFFELCQRFQIFKNQLNEKRR